MPRTRVSCSPSSAAAGCRRGSSSRPTTTPPTCALARHGITFRHRVEDGTGLWQLKLPRDAARLELELGGPPARPPAELVDLLPAFLRGAPLVPVARLRTRREVVLAQGAEIVDDSVAVLEGQRVSRRFREVEVELIDGDEKALRRLAKELRKAGAHETGELKPKLYRALDLNGTPAAARADEGHAAGRGARDRARRRLPGAPRPRPGHAPRRRSGGPASAPRRDAAAAGISPRGAPARRSRVGRVAAGEELGWLGGHLGPARDLDVMLDRLRAEVAALGDDAEAAAGLLEGLEADRADAYRDVVETLRGDRYLALLDRLEAAAEPPLSGEEKTLTKIFHREAKRMRRTFAELGDDPEDDALHRSRIAVKRARYAADLAAHELGKPGARFVAVAKQLQDILGDHQDAVVAQERIREWAESAHRLRRAGSPRAGSSSSSATGWRPPAPRGPRRGSGSTRPPGGRSAETRSSRRWSRRPGRRRRARGAPRPSSGLRRLDLPEGEARPRRDRGGMRPPRGRGGDGPPLHARARAAVDDVQGREGPAQARAVLADGGRVRELAFDNETDDARWLTFDEAAGMLSYARDTEVLDSLR